MVSLNRTSGSKYFSWKITNFNLHPQLFDKPVCSPHFSLDSFGTTKFSLHLYPRGTGKKIKCLCVKLIWHKLDFGHLFQTKYELRLRIDEDVNEKVLCIDFSKYNKEICWILSDVVEDDTERNISMMERKNYLLLHDLNIYLKIIPISSGADFFWASTYLDLEMLSYNIEKGIKSSNHCDLNFIVSGNKFFTAHKAIVSSRYPMLAKKLGFSGNQMQEFQFRTDPETIQVLLKYLYSGELDISNVPSGIYDVLDNVEVHHLKNLLFSIPKSIFVITNICTRHCDFIWSIPKFSELQENVKLSYSLCCDELLKWTNIRIVFYFTRNDKNEQWVAFAIRRIYSGSTVRITCRISFVDVPFFHKEYDHMFENEIEWKIPEFVKKQVLISNNDLFIRKDTLRIKFEFKMSDGMYTSDICTVKFLEETITEHNSVAKEYWTLQQDLIRLYRNPVFSDVTLYVGKEMFPAHKVILSLRSMTFYCMFASATSQEKSNKVEINNFDPSVIEAMLSYIYSGEISRKGMNFEFVSDLYAAAVEYRLHVLKRKCEKYLKRVLSVKNAGDILLIADVHGDTDLKKYVHDFVCSNAEDILHSREWRRIMGIRLDLAEELLRVILTSKIS